MAKTFRIERDSIDTTFGGWFGEPASTYNESIAGLTHYFVDDVEVSAEEYTQAVRQEQAERFFPICQVCGWAIARDRVPVPTGGFVHEGCLPQTTKP